MENAKFKISSIAGVSSIMLSISMKIVQKQKLSNHLSSLNSVKRNLEN
jgi:hypothetical protein